MKIKINFFSVYFFISLIIYFISPEKYSYEYCFMVHNLFLLNAGYITYLDRKNEKIGFNLLFSLAFYFTNFVYPVFVYPILPNYSLFRYAFNEDVITQCSSLALVAYTAYSWGYFKKMEPEPYEGYTYQYGVSSSATKYILLSVFAFILLYYKIGGYDFYSALYTSEGSTSNILANYMMLFIPAFSILLVSFVFLLDSLKSRLLLTSVLVLFAFSLLLVGSRTYPLSIFCMLYIVFCLRHKVSYKFVLLSMIAGVLLMSFVGMVRGAGVSEADLSSLETESEIGMLDKLLDLIVNNRNLYVLYDYVDKESITYGLSFLANIFAPVPFLQGFFEKVTGIPSYMTNSATLSTYLTHGPNPPFGMGTNVVADTYVAFGLLGTIVMFYFLGKIMIIVRDKMMQGSFCFLIIYLAMAGNAVFMVRGGYFENLRSIVWVLIVCTILYQKFSFIKETDEQPHRDD